MTTGVGAGVISGERFRSWADIQANAARAAGGFASIGIGEDDSVALMLRNDFATFEANMAAGQLGAYAVPINWHFTAEEAGYILQDCRAKADRDVAADPQSVLRTALGPAKKWLQLWDQRP